EEVVVGELAWDGIAECHDGSFSAFRRYRSTGLFSFSGRKRLSLPVPAERELRALQEAGELFPSAGKRLLTLTRDGAPREVPAGIVVQPAYEWLLARDAELADRPRGIRRDSHAPTTGQSPTSWR